MYEKLIIALLLSGYASAGNNVSHPNTTVTTPPIKTAGTLSTPLQGSFHFNQTVTLREQPTQKAHLFSEPVITVIILAVMAGIIGIILFIAFFVGRLRKKSTFDEQFSPSHDTGLPENYIETANPESNQ
ncbi:glycophorin-A isoform X1 [Tamandua tetradactyla]|uniref:glycophorin-A isoform X1 n=1 Tax=Tamandua tetradactyla TaxID=48850 RepID=UPI0040547EA7